MSALLDIHELRQTFPRADGGELLVLDGVELTLNEGQIVGLLGRTGSGKSTLLRLIAGLAQPSGGTVTYLGKPVHEPADGIAMVFQGFALFPWLTVLENVQLGLEALGLPEPEIRKRALAAIDLIGLDGYEFGVSARAVRWHAPARRFCPRARRASEHSADGRAILGARRADRRDVAHRLSRTVGRRQAADQGRDPGHAQYRGSGADVRPHPVCSRPIRAASSARSPST